MNLHGIAGPIIGAINPQFPVTVRVSSGATTAASGKRTPTYSDLTGIPAQVQALSYKDIRQVEGLNLNGTRRAIYLYGKFDGIVRSEVKGGDLIVFPADAPRNPGANWLVAQVLEQWPDWCKIAVTLQQPVS